MVDVKRIGCSRRSYKKENNTHTNDECCHTQLNAAKGNSCLGHLVARKGS